MTDRLHYYLESNDPALYRIKHKKHVLCKINMREAVKIQNINFPASRLQRQYDEYRASKLRKFALNQTIGGLELANMKIGTFSHVGGHQSQGAQALASLSPA